MNQIMNRKLTTVNKNTFSTHLSVNGCCTLSHREYISYFFLMMRLRPCMCVVCVYLLAPFLFPGKHPVLISISYLVHCSRQIQFSIHLSSLHRSILFISRTISQRESPVRLLLIDGRHLKCNILHASSET